MDKIRRTPWGVRKAEKLYIEKIKGGEYSISGATENISFAYKYLCD
ncbi:hypothetical protein [Clostridium kluyveri]|nr:hypothetical protein [Clostridium kluyveri]UZQ49139.1 hypothetical protein OP486_14380 [Clostridium kluyveri]